MSKRTEYVTYGEHTFKVVAHKDRCAFYHGVYRYRTLDECYDRPSDTKRSIYRAWKDYFLDTFGAIGTHCGIISFNYMMFTFGCDTMVKYNGGLCDASFYITKTRNEVILYDL